MIADWDKLTEQLGHDVVVAVRRAIWERHGNATEWAVRVVDDFRLGQSTVVAPTVRPRPATRDDVVAAIMVVCEG